MTQRINPTDKAMELFAEMMIEKLENVSQGNWHKPWFTEGGLRWPKNLAGREYNGINVLMLLILCEKRGYKIPRFVTFEGVQRLNDGEDAKGQPRVLVNKGAKSFPIILTMFYVYHKETRERIKYEEYVRLSPREQEEYKVIPQWRVFRVFNVEQTNLKDARPLLWATLEAEYTVDPTAKEDAFHIDEVDRMIDESLWICPIEQQYQDSAYYSIGRNEIVVPEKAQFKDGESFYGTLFHEMIHSTGAADALGRVKAASFGSAEYAREELVAELGAALVCQMYGIQKYVKTDSTAYLKSWLDTLKASPSFIRIVLSDVKRAVSLVRKKLDDVSARKEIIQEEPTLQVC